MTTVVEIVNEQIVVVFDEAESLTLIAAARASALGGIETARDAAQTAIAADREAAQEAIADDRSAALTAIGAAGDAEIIAVGAAGTSQINLVTVEGDEQVARVALTPGAQEYASTADAVSMGAAGLSGLVGGSGGTNGTFALAFSGGGGSGAAGYFVVAGGAVTSAVITAKGRGYTSDPTVSFSASSGLTGASVTVNRAQNRTAGQYFVIPVTDGYQLYTVTSGTTTATVGAVMPNITAINALIAQCLADAQAASRLKVDARPPLQPDGEIVNIAPDRFTLTTDTTVPLDRWAGSSGHTATYVWNADAREESGEPNLIRFGFPSATLGQQRPSVSYVITAAELVALGFVPDDGTPPEISLSASMRKDSSVNQTIDSASVSSNAHIWFALRYDGAGAALTGDISTTKDVAFRRAETGVVSGHLGVADALWTGNAGGHLSTDTRKAYKRDLIKVPATYGGKALTGIIIRFFGKATAAGDTSLDVGQITIRNGETIDLTETYLNDADKLDDLVRWSDLNDDTVYSRLFLAGPGSSESYVESNRSGYGVKNTFVAMPSVSLTTKPYQFNLQKVYLDGVLIRDGSDDVAPDVVGAGGSYVGGKHGYSLYTCTASAHGKTTDDEGSVWSKSGVEAVLVQVVSSSSLLLAHRTADEIALTSGTWSHVSGATNTGGITVTGTPARSDWFPPQNNYSIRVLADGVDVTDQTGVIDYTHDVVIVETADILPRPTIIDWWIANGGASAGVVPEGDPSFTTSTAYRFDRDGQMTVLRDWLFTQVTPVYELYGLQVGYVGTPDTFYIPSAVPFTYDGETVDYGEGVAADRTIGHATLNFTASELQASGEYADRVLSLWDDHVFAVGFLPVGDAAPSVRRTRTSAQALQIANTAKLYFRVLDTTVVGEGPTNSAVGDHYAAIGYRVIVPRTAERTAFYVVRTEGADFIFADWHDKAVLDRLPIPADLIGRTFEVVDSRNVTVNEGLLAGSLPVVVDAAGDRAYLVAKVS